jgi:hypothetical protein
MVKGRSRVEESVVGAERAATLTDAQRRGLRYAVDLWRDEIGGPREFAFDGSVLGTKKRPRVRRGYGLGHGGLIRWVTDDDGTRWPAMRDEEMRADGVKGPLCPMKWNRMREQFCYHPAGWRTSHPGIGACRSHGGNKTRVRAEAAWVAAHGFAQELNVNPWEALLMAVRIAAGKVAYIESVLASAPSDLALEGRAVVVNTSDPEDASGRDQGAQMRSRLLIHPDTGEPLGVGEYRDLTWWVQKGEVWHDRLAKTAKMAVDAGIAAWQVEQVETDAHNIARVLNAVVEQLDGKISEEQASEIRSIMRAELLRIDAEQNEQTGRVLELTQGVVE